MVNHCSPGDRVVCKVKDGKIVNIYDDSVLDTQIFDIIVKYNEEYLVYIPLNLYIKNSFLITPENNKHYGVGKKFVGDPEVWRVIDGTLYLNLDAGIQDMWLKDVPGRIASADDKWKKIKNKSPASL